MIYKGRILSDNARTLADYGIGAGDSSSGDGIIIYLVKGSATNTTGGGGGAGAAVNNNGNTGGDGGNIATLVMFENTSVGIVEPTLRNQVLVYPNPTRNVIKIKNTKTDMNEAIAELYSVSGQLVLSENISLKKDNPQILNVSNLDNGYYILIIRNGDESLEEKVLIQN